MWVGVNIGVNPRLDMKAASQPGRWEPLHFRVCRGAGGRDRTDNLRFTKQWRSVPFRSTGFGTDQFPGFMHILLSRAFRCVPFRQRVLLAVLLADESGACQSNRTSKCGLDTFEGTSHVGCDHCQMDCTTDYP